jgi:hypothetical protein
MELAIIVQVVVPSPHSSLTLYDASINSLDPIFYT